jgi:hypothetical protein
MGWPFLFVLFTSLHNYAIMADARKKSIHEEVFHF